MSEPIEAVRDPGFGVYIHWPFCAQKCPYCDFNSHVRHQGWDEARLLSCYERELAYVAEHSRERTVSSVFFGGGTPSLMKPETVGAVLDCIGKLWPVARDAEITLEANPGSVEASRFRGYRAAGINRVSMGLQSLRDDELKRLGRIHTVAEAKAALEIARKTFERFSFDLIYARPGQSPEAWCAELAEALTLAGDHISLYQLTIEPDTPFAALHALGKLVVPDPDAALRLYEVTQELTDAKGLRAYEISNHAIPGAESRHNLVYWRYGTYAGIGPGAHGRLLTGSKRLATVAERNPELWCERVERQGHGYTEQTELTLQEQADEMLLMGLRLSEGVDLRALAALGGVVPAQRALEELRELGLVEITSSCPDGEMLFDGGNWRENELQPIHACLGPGEPPELMTVHSPCSVCTTLKGRFILNALVTHLSSALVPLSEASRQGSSR